jgi:hypothetical protein
VRIPQSLFIQKLAPQLPVLLVTCLIFPILSAPAQTVTTDPPYTEVDRGAHYRVLQKTVSVTNAQTGEITQEVHAFTELEDGMHYWTNNTWADARDLIEITPTGAQAVHGQMTAQFSGDITSIGAIKLTTPAGDVFQSRPAGLYYFDSALGQVTRISSVQSSQAILYPPNAVVYSNLLSGINADLMLVWARNGYAQNLVIKQSLPSPESFGFSSATTRVQLWTAMDSCPVPVRQRTFTLRSGLVDHILDFNDCWFPVGSAFALGTVQLPRPGQPLLVRASDPSAPDSIPVAKSLVDMNGSTVLVEEINYSDLANAAAAAGLPQASITTPHARAVEVA